MIDFSKAFLQFSMSKLKKFPIPANILKWIISFLTDRLQSVIAILYKARGGGVRPNILAPAPKIPQKTIFGYFSMQNLLQSERSVSPALMELRS